MSDFKRIVIHRQSLRTFPAKAGETIAAFIDDNEGAEFVIQVDKRQFAIEADMPKKQALPKN